MCRPAGAISVSQSWYTSYEQKALFWESDVVSWMCDMVTFYHMMYI